MIIREIHVRNFRSIEDAVLPCEKLTVLVGPNGAGKSSFLHALRLFYTLGVSYSEQDFYNGNISDPIIIAITFGELTSEEKKLFKPYLDGETLTVEKVLSYPRGKGSERYYGKKLRHREFEKVRKASRATEKRRLYNQLIELGYDLPKVSRADQIEPNLNAWELQHPDQCERMRDEGQFFGFKEVGSSRLERFTQFLFVPAVRDASLDAIEGKGSVLTDLMDLVVRSALSQREELRQFQAETQARYEGIVDPTKLPELRTLEADLTQTLRTFVPNASVELAWQPIGTIEVPMPKADIKLVEDGFPAPVDRTGHGLQRAFILTMLQHLTLVRARVTEVTLFGDENETGDTVIRPDYPSLILGIEEPELYQHPSRQRHFSNILLKLATDGIPRVAESVQVIYSTHSPLFVDIERFDQVRVLRKELVEKELPRQTKVYYISLDEVAKRIQEAQDDCKTPFTSKTLKPRLATLMTPWKNEGFFADVVVLVEGESDRAAIVGTALAAGIDLDALGICVIPCGKTGLDRPFAIFSGLNIPVYLLWDGDFGGKNPDQAAKNNRALLRLLGEQPEDWPEKLESTFACFRTKLEVQLKQEIGEELFESLLEKHKTDLGLAKKNDAIKNPVVISKVLHEARAQGRTSQTLDQIIEAILNLRPEQHTSEAD